MKFNRRIYNLYQIGKNITDRGQKFNKNYIKTYNEHKTIHKDHYILKHAFNIENYMKNKNNEINPSEYLKEEKKERLKYNIYNFKTTLKPKKSFNKLNSLDDELLKIFLFKIDKKNIEDEKKTREEKMHFESLRLKGIKKRNKQKIFINSLNKIKSSDSYNNISNYGKYMNNILSNTNINNYSKTTESRNISLYNNIKKKFESPKNFFFNNLNNRLKDICQSINLEQKNILLKSDFFKNYFKSKLKTISTEKTKYLKINKSIEKIKKKKDLENILFSGYDCTFNKIKKNLYTLYKFSNKLKI